MVISSFIAEFTQKERERVRTELEEFSGVEIHKVIDNTKFILTLEKRTLDESYKTADRMSKISGLTHLCLVYTNFEDEVAGHSQAET
ncbi:chaperone NapD [Salipaludibacillus aurantiacus]|uniref:NapD protein n=1 Tax=Salipaludibacillus aurantiacus TaxID=1601833 RepID=A0A1H9P1F6_9BACI|nr:chaperone NapD [Salipaludibacillus aurantiacus]SER42124.1 NapD protein [Salipaludibacillus aurantiacus]